MSSAIELVSRFFGYGSAMTKSTFGDGAGMSGLGQIDGEFKGRLNEFRNISFGSTNPEVAIRDEREAAQLMASADVYSSRLRSNQKKAGAYVKAAVARLNHDVAINQANSQLVAAQTRAVSSHARIGFKNGVATASAQGTVAGYTGENKNVFDF
jgi:hypothetical protein